MIRAQDVNGHECHIAYRALGNTQQLLVFNEAAAQGSENSPVCALFVRFAADLRTRKEQNRSDAFTPEIVHILPRAGRAGAQVELLLVQTCAFRQKGSLLGEHSNGSLDLTYQD
ncbi:unnamed protein product [Rangifer tarandus platyrhynchus]|uniref:Uncharacterized protein n=1 Tax=Rangifer tarandus platyrhynchus TaxID=3082113 RepID=A0AC59YFE6_RANTA